MSVLLVADNEKNIRAFYKDTLENEGYKVISAKDGRSTLEKIEKEKIDLVILDIKMPDIDGLEVLSEISRKKESPPVLINTAYSGFLEDYRCWIAEDYIMKSSNPAELLRKIKEVLRKKRN